MLFSAHLHLYKAFCLIQPFSNLLYSIIVIMSDSLRIHGNGMVMNHSWCDIHCCNDITFIVESTFRQGIPWSWKVI